MKKKNNPPSTKTVDTKDKEKKEDEEEEEGGEEKEKKSRRAMKVRDMKDPRLRSGWRKTDNLKMSNWGKTLLRRFFQKFFSIYFFVNV